MLQFDAETTESITEIVIAWQSGEIDKAQASTELADLEEISLFIDFDTFRLNSRGHGTASWYDLDHAGEYLGEIVTLDRANIHTAA